MGNKQLSLVLVGFLTWHRCYHSNNVILLPLLLLIHKSWNSSAGRICSLKSNRINFAIEWFLLFRTEVGKLFIYLFLTVLLTGHITQYTHLKIRFKWRDLSLKIFGKKWRTYVLHNCRLSRISCKAAVGPIKCHAAWPKADITLKVHRAGLHQEFCT